MEPIDIEEQVSITVDGHEIVDAESDSESSHWGPNKFRFLTRNGMMKVEEEKKEHDMIKKSFVKGMGPFGKDTSVVGMHTNLHSGIAAQARFETFRIFSEAVANKCGGNANIKYAWYGASKGEICEILSHGFSRCRLPQHSQLFGHGVYLSPANFSIDGSLSSSVDENGLRHLLLCRVILGNMEEISLGSEQFQPSSKDFDSGVDNLSSPKKYIIWRAYMNSHILPAYIISFKAPCLTGLPRIPTYTVKPNSPYMRFPNLMSILANYIQPSHMSLIDKYYSDFRENKITRTQLIRRLRQIVGDELLIAVIKAYRDKRLDPKTKTSEAAGP